MAFSENVELLGYSDLGGKSGFKLAMQEVGGRFYLYVTALWRAGLSILEVTNPERPRLLRWVPGPPNTWSLQVQVAGGKMVTSLEPIPKGQGWGGDPDAKFDEGLVVWDVRDPADPKVLGKWSAGANGTHRNYYAGGRFVHAAITLPGFVGRLYGVIDIDDPEHPKLVGKWWYPGQNRAAGESFSAIDERKRSHGKPFPNEAISHHGAPYLEDGRVFCPWSRGGMVILNVEDVLTPQLVSVFSPYPPLGSSNAVHTVVPLMDRKLAIVNSEALFEKRKEPLNFAGIIDISDERDPILVSLFPIPNPPPGYDDDYWDRGGRFGPHNQHQPQGLSCLQPSGSYVYLTYFNAGLQIYDISQPRSPRIAGYFIPDDPNTRQGPLPTDLVTQVEDVLVDRRGIIYVSEKNTGVYVLKFTPKTIRK
jgi:hypothetical protein